MATKMIGEYLIEAGKITPEQLQAALATQANSMRGGKMPLIGTVLVEMKALEERDLAQSLERQEKDRREYNPMMYPPDVTDK